MGMEKILKDALSQGLALTLQNISSSLENESYMYISAELIKQKQRELGHEIQDELNNTHLFKVVDKHKEGDKVLYKTSDTSCCKDAKFESPLFSEVSYTSQQIRELGAREGRKLCGQCMAHVFADKP